MLQNTRAKAMKINEIIRKLDNDKYRLYSKKGKNLGTYDSRKGAEERERQVQYFKHMGENTTELNEIEKDTRTSKGDVDRYDFDEYIGQTKKIGKLGGYEIHFSKGTFGSSLMKTGGGEYHNFLIKDPDSEGFLGLLQLTKKENGFWYSIVMFDEEIQGKGLAVPLYAMAVKKGYTIVSDKTQTKGSQSVWSRLAKTPGIFVYAWNTTRSVQDDKAFFQWDPGVDPEEEVYHDPDAIDQIRNEYKNRISDIQDQVSSGKITKDQANSMMRQAIRDRDQAVRDQDENRFKDVRLVATATGKNINENFTKPQFDVEWEEANRYDFLDKLGKDGWIELAQTGKAVTVDTDSVKKIGNTGADGSETFDDLEPEKVARFKKAMKSGTIEMPIVMKMPNSELELIAGNTRLIGLINTTGKATVWYIDASRLEEGVQEASSKDNYGIPNGATLAQLDRIAKTATNPEKRERAHWLRNMQRGNNKK